MTNPHKGLYDANPHTEALRPQIKLTQQQIEDVRHARKNGRESSEIAMSMNIPIEDVNIALAQLRTPLSNRDRVTVNASLGAHKILVDSQLSGETMKQTLDRLLGVK